MERSDARKRHTPEAGELTREQRDELRAKAEAARSYEYPGAGRNLQKELSPDVVLALLDAADEAERANGRVDLASDLMRGAISVAHAERDAARAEATELRRQAEALADEWDVTTLIVGGTNRRPVPKWFSRRLRAVLAQGNGQGAVDEVICECGYDPATCARQCDPAVNPNAKCGCPAPVVVGGGEGEGVSQTIFASPELQAIGVYGNCMQAAIATVLNRPMDSVPHFGTFATWPQALRLWLRGEGLDYTYVEAPPIPVERAMLVGKSPRGYTHAVVSEGGQIVWDPHPSRDGLVTVTGGYVIHEWDTDSASAPENANPYRDPNPPAPHVELERGYCCDICRRHDGE